MPIRRPTGYGKCRSIARDKQAKPGELSPSDCTTLIARLRDTSGSGLDASRDERVLISSRTLGLSAVDENKVYYENARKLLKL